MKLIGTVAIIPSMKQSLLFVALAAIAFLAYTAAFAAAGTEQVIDWGHMTMGLFGGLALFLFGMEQISDALKSALGDTMSINMLAPGHASAWTGQFVHWYNVTVQSEPLLTLTGSA